jgi:hydrogenase expression/formation protein HypC
MCRSIPGQVIEITDPVRRLARVQIDDQVQAANMGMFEPGEIAVGDWVLVQAGLVVERLSAEQAQEVRRLLDEIAQFFEEDER